MRLAGDHRFFRLLTALFRRSLNINTLAVMVFPESQGVRILDTWIEDPRLDSEFREIYVKGAYRLDPYFQHSKQVRSAAFHRLKDIAPDRFFTTEYFRRYYRRVAYADEMGLLMPYGEHAAMHLSVSRRGTEQGFASAERRALVAMAPVLGVLLLAHYGSPSATPPDEPDSAPLATRITIHARSEFGVDLTSREALVLQHVLEGYSNVAIGMLIDVSPLTVKVHRRNAYRKLRISSQAELFAAFIPALAK